MVLLHPVVLPDLARTPGLHHAKEPKAAPSYRLHKPSGQAVVTLNGRDFYLGRHGAETSRDAYDRLIGQWLGRHRAPPVEVAKLAAPERAATCIMNSFNRTATGHTGWSLHVAAHR